MRNVRTRQVLAFGLMVAANAILCLGSYGLKSIGLSVPQESTLPILSATPAAILTLAGYWLISATAANRPTRKATQWVSLILFGKSIGWLLMTLLLKESGNLLYHGINGLLSLTGIIAMLYWLGVVVRNNSDSRQTRLSAHAYFGWNYGLAPILTLAPMFLPAEAAAATLQLFQAASVVIGLACYCFLFMSPAFSGSSVQTKEVAHPYRIWNSYFTCYVIVIVFTLFMSLIIEAVS